MGEEVMNQTDVVELLKDMKGQNNKKLFYLRLLTAIFAVICIAIVSVIPSVISTLDTTKATMAHLNDTITTMDDTITTMDETLDAITAMADTGTTGITEALEKIESIDFEGLNSAIGDLETVVEPMAKFFEKFK